MSVFGVIILLLVIVHLWWRLDYLHRRIANIEIRNETIVDQLRAQLAKAEAANKVLTEAIEFYADAENYYSILDKSVGLRPLAPTPKRAREALAKARAA